MGVGAWIVLIVGGLAALAVCAGVMAFARAAQAGRTGLVWRATLVVAAAVILHPERYIPGVAD